MDSNNSQNNNNYKSKDTFVGSRLSDFEIIKQLGKGSYGTVYTVKSRLDSNVYVMKKMELNHLKESQQRECYREVSILRKVSHPNIIKYYASFLENESLCIIMEYAELGDLYTLIKHYKRHQKYFDELLLWRISYEVLTGLEYLHSNNIIHRDIKCLNLFLSKDHHVKIGDLGVSTISALGGMHCTRVGTPLYLSPELVKQVPYDYKTDIWSFGCSLYHLASLDPPFTGNNLIVLGNNIVKGRPKDLPNMYSNDLKLFIDKMLTKKPEKRPSAKEAKELIPKNILEKISLAYKNKIEIKSRPFSSVGNRKSNDNSNTNYNSNNNINNNNNNNININIYKENDEEKNIYNNNNNEIQNNNINIKENKKDNNILNNNRNENNLKDKKGSNSLEYNLNANNKYGFDNNNINIKKDNDINKIEENIIIEDKKNWIKPNNNLGDKSGSLFNVLNVQKGFNFFRNNFTYKKSKDQRTSKNFIYSNNKIINNNNTKNSSIKVYSAAFKKELLDFQKNEKNLPKFTEEEKINMQSQKKEEKKPFTTDTNIQLISINNNNIIINNIDNNYMSNSSSNNDKNTKNDTSKRELIIKNNHDKKQTKKDKETIESKIIENENILFPNLKLNKASSVKDANHTLNKHINFDIDKNKINNIINNNKIYSQKGTEILMKPKKNRPFSSGQFKPNSNRRIVSTFNKNFMNNELSLNNNMHKKLNSGRPSTGFKPNFNNNVMNININFFNIDMNRRFLAPEINPLNSNENESNRDNNDIKKNSNIYNSNINLKNFKNTNEFIFQKLIKAIQDINNEKKLTINDLH